jgi:hypothetical protein
MVTEVIEADREVSNRWYVSNGATAVGPVELELIARGIEAGKVPLESFVRNEMWKVWRPVSEIVVHETDEGDEAPTSFREEDVGLREELSPTEMIAAAADTKEALLLGMSAVVRALDADAALVHEARDGGAVVVCAHGGDMFEGLGDRVAVTDPAYAAASLGYVVVAEPTPGPVGAMILSRMSRAGEIAGAAMFPLKPRDRFFGMLEVGRRMPFKPRELARAEELVMALVARLEKAGRSQPPAPPVRRT